MVVIRASISGFEKMFTSSFPDAKDVVVVVLDVALRVRFPLLATFSYFILFSITKTFAG